MKNFKELPLRLIFLVAAVSNSEKGKIIGPISMGSWKHHTPTLLLSLPMKALGVTDSDDSFSPQRVYWVQGECFLDVNKTFEDQLVRRNDVLIVTDEENDDLVAAVASMDLEHIKRNKTGATDWSSLSNEIRRGG